MLFPTVCINIAILAFYREKKLPHIIWKNITHLSVSLIRIDLFHPKSDTTYHQNDATEAAKSTGTKITAVDVEGTDLALLNTVSSDAGYAFSAVAFNNDAANIGDQMTAKLRGKDGGLRR